MSTNIAPLQHVLCVRFGAGHVDACDQRCHIQLCSINEKIPAFGWCDAGALAVEGCERSKEWHCNACNSTSSSYRHRYGTSCLVVDQSHSCVTEERGALACVEGHVL
jgi:hypothetical protein